MRFKQAGLFLCILLGGSLLSNAGDLPLYSSQLFDSMLARWRVRDGDLGRMISDYWCDYATMYPAEFLKNFAAHEKEFTEWVAELGSLSFTDFGGCLDRECLRKMMLNSLELCDDCDTARQERSALVTRLRKIRVRRIE